MSTTQNPNWQPLQAEPAVKHDLPDASSTPVFAIETHGINPIPSSERWAKPKDVFGLIFGGANSLSTVVLGTFGVVFGLTFWDGLLAIVLGVLLGSLILAPMVFFGPANGTNNAVSSTAHFGSHGRLLGSILALMSAFTFLALAIWASGDALIASLARLFSFEVSASLSAVTYVLVSLAIIAICVYGYKLLVVLNRYVPVVVGILFIIGIVVFSLNDSFSTALAYSVDNRWSDPFYIGAFIGVMLIAMSCPISYGAFLGDYSRYVAKRTNKISLVAAVILAQLAALCAFLFGHVTASVIAVTNADAIYAGDYVGGLVAIAPTWFFVPLALVSVAGGITTGTGLLYGTGLDFSSIIVSLKRVTATILIGVIAVLFVLVGKFAFNIVASVTTLSTILVICTVPWIVIMMIGFFTRRGWYDIDSLLVFSRHQKGGKYWFSHGWNINAVTSFIIGVTAGLSFVNLPGQFVGPFGNAVGGIDISLLVALVLPAAAYSLLLWVNPEPRYVFGPEGSRAVPVKEHLTEQEIVA